MYKPQSIARRCSSSLAVKVLLAVLIFPFVKPVQNGCRAQPGRTGSLNDRRCKRRSDRFKRRGSAGSGRPQPGSSFLLDGGQFLLLLHGKNPVEVAVVFLAHGG